MKPNLVISCPATSRSGYGDHSRDLIRSLIKIDKYNIRILDQIWGNCPKNQLGENDKDISSLIIPPSETGKLQQPDIWIQITVPNEFQPIGKYNIGITAGIETTNCHADWILGCNRMDRVIVPSEHSKYVFKSMNYKGENPQTKEPMPDLTLDRPIDVLMEGLDMEFFNKTNTIPKTIDSTLNSIKEDFCFLFCGHWLNGGMGHDRKDVGMTIRVFLETFKDKAPKNMPALILKTSGAGFSLTEREDILRKIQQIRHSMGSNKALPNVYLLHGDLSKEELNGLYNHSKVKAMVSFTKGEGFGRPLLEFSVTGKPTIASNWSGHVDFLSAHGVMLPGKLNKVDPSVVWEKVILEDSEWFTVDYGYAASILKDVHKQYKKYHEKSRKQTQYVKENFTLDIMTEQFEEILNNISSLFEVKLPKVEEMQTYE
jgi:glycosyltransferase involved in cell wall biosynthesis